MKIKKILIVKPIVNDTDPTATGYKYPKSFNPEHASHICYNFFNGKNLKGGHLAEGMVIYIAEREEIKALLKEKGVTEISYANATVKGKKWHPATIIDGVEKPAFDITKWVKKSEINTETL